mgnify:CR=1 FL=1
MKATFSRPVTAVVVEEEVSEAAEDDDVSVDEVLITQLKEALADPVSTIWIYAKELITIKPNPASCKHKRAMNILCRNSLRAAPKACSDILNTEPPRAETDFYVTCTSI